VAIMTKTLAILLCLFMLVGSLPYHPGITDVRGGSGNETTTTSVEILDVAPGESRCLIYNSSTSELAVMPLPDVYAGLPESVSEAIMKVPLWLRPDLSKKFGELSEVTLNVGSRSAPAFADLDGDGDRDLTVGSEDDLRYFENVGNRLMPIWQEDTDMYESIQSSLGSRSTPAFADMDSDGDFDLTLGRQDGTLLYFENTGTTAEAAWKEDSSMYQGINAGGHSNPALADIDHDGDPDLTIGSATNALYYYVNDDGSWTLHPAIYESIDLTGYTAPALCDLDDDGDFDLTLGKGDGTVRYFRDTGTSGHNWVEDPTLYGDGERRIKVGSSASPALADLDGDHCFDLMVGSGSDQSGEGDGEAMYFRNLGTARNPGFVDMSSGMVHEYDTQELTGVTVAQGVVEPTRKVMVRADIELVDTYARLIVDADEQYADEIGFSIAHTPTSILRRSDVYPEVFRENAELIYKIDPELDYVDLVEKSGPEGAYTTTTYRVNESGELKLFDLPRDIYYWYIVHPKITDEIPTYIDPETGNPAAPVDGGRFWREYLFYHNDTEYPSDPGGGVCYPKDEGPPLLQEKIRGVEIMWNCTTHRSPGGYDNDGHNNGRPWDHGDHAIERISNWVEKTLPLNAQEDSDGRPIQPVRIAYEHNGNCGELQDLSTSAGRTCLIPVQGVCDIAEDHVYQEFWERGWHHWDNWWSDGGTGVDMPLMYDGHWYDISVVWAHRGNDYIRNVNHRPYTPTGTLKITILDRFGEPVDGAFIVANSHFIAEDITGVPFAPPPIPCFWNYTDTSGECLLKLGKNDYTINIWSSLGSVPDQQISVEEGQEYDRTFYVDGKKPTHDIQPQDRGSISGDSETIRFGFRVLEGTQDQVSLFEGTRHPQPIFMNRDIDFFICDEENYIAYLKGYEFDCHELEENVVEGTVDLTVPKDTDWYFVFSNTGPLQTGKKIEIITEEVIWNENPEVEISEPVSGIQVEIGDIVSIRGNATDDSDLERLEISLDGGESWQSLMMDYNNPEWFYRWDTSNVSDGDYRIIVEAYDAYGCKGKDSITIIVGEGDEEDDTNLLDDIMDNLEDNWYITGGGAALLALVVAGAVVAMRRRKGARDAEPVDDFDDDYEEDEDDEYEDDEAEDEDVSDAEKV